jgi:hypothetical protein
LLRKVEDDPLPVTTANFLRSTRAAIGLAIIIAINSSASGRADLSLVPGSWYTEGVEHGEYLQAFVTFQSDGTFKKLLRTVIECKVRAEWIESGNWTYANAQLQFITNQVANRTIDPSDEYYINTFNVSPLDSSHLQIFDIETKLTWKLKTASPPLEFPKVPSCVVAYA